MFTVWSFMRDGYRKLVSYVWLTFIKLDKDIMAIQGSLYKLEIPVLSRMPTSWASEVGASVVSLGSAWVWNFMWQKMMKCASFEPLLHISDGSVLLFERPSGIRSYASCVLVDQKYSVKIQLALERYKLLSLQWWTSVFHKSRNFLGTSVTINYSK